MRILYCESGSGQGGSANSLVQFLAGARGTAIEPTVLCYTDTAWERFSALGVPVLQLDLGRFVHCLRETRRLFKTERIDLLHANNDIYSHIPTILLAATCNVPMIAHHRALRKLTRAERVLWKSILRHIAVSDSVRDDLISQGITPAAINTIYDAIAVPDPGKIDPEYARRKLKLGDSVRLVGTIGSLRPEKGLEILVEAAMDLGNRPEIHFVVIGGEFHRTPGYAAELEAIVQREELGGRFHFTGHLEDPSPWIASLDLLVFPTLLPEGFGRAALEGMACEVPVLASAIGAVPEVIQDGTTGYLVPPGDAQALADRIRQALAVDNAQLVARARKVAATKFSLPVQVEQVVQIYTDVLRITRKAGGR